METVQEKNDFVFQSLSDVKNHTEEIISGLMKKAIIAPNPFASVGSPWCSRPAALEEKQAFGDKCCKMAIKFLWILKRSKTRWMPPQSCVDLTTTGAALTRDEEAMSVDEVREMWAADQVKIRKARRVRRHFVNCLGCDKRFLAKRANNLTCSPRCRQRATRRASLSQIPAQTPLQTA